MKRVPEPSFEEFFLDEFPRLVSMLSAWCGDRHQAEDLAQDALFVARQRWPEVGGLESPGGWVRRVALNRSSNELRRRRRERVALGRLRSRPPTTAEALPDDDLWAEVRRLPAKQRDAVILRYVGDLPLRDIAEVLGCREGTVKTHLQRARRTLAAMLDGQREEAS